MAFSERSKWECSKVVRNCRTMAMPSGEALVAESHVNRDFLERVARVGAADGALRFAADGGTRQGVEARPAGGDVVGRQERALSVWSFAPELVEGLFEEHFEDSGFGVQVKAGGWTFRVMGFPASRASGGFAVFVEAWCVKTHAAFQARPTSRPWHPDGALRVFEDAEVHELIKAFSAVATEDLVGCAIGCEGRGRWRQYRGRRAGRCW